MKYFLQFAFYTIIIAALVVININQLTKSSADSYSPISAPITSPIETPSPTPTPDQNNNNGGSNNSSNNSSNGGGSSDGGSAPVCGDQTPGTPILLNVIKTGPNQVMLTWSKPIGPVTSYILAYGLTPTKMLYGDPNVGNVNKYVVNHLQAGTAYYFRVRAANGCMPGVFSNSLGVSAYGKVLGYQAPTSTKIAAGFKPGIVSSQPKQNAAVPVVNNTQTQSAPQINLPQVNLSQFANNVFGQVLHFLYR